MVVRIRLARFGRTNAPFYNIVVSHARYGLFPPAPTSPSARRQGAGIADICFCSLSRTARNSRPLEVIGTYDPIPKKDTYDESGRLHKDVKLDVLRAKYWIGVGAQPSDTVWRLLSMVRTGPFPSSSTRSKLCSTLFEGGI